MAAFSITLPPRPVHREAPLPAQPPHQLEVPVPYSFSLGHLSASATRPGAITYEITRVQRLPPELGPFLPPLAPGPWLRPA